MMLNTSLRKGSSNEEPVQRIIIGIAGGSAAGKTTLCQNINRQMAFDRNFKVEIISLDCFYKSIDKKLIDVRDYNFDHPSALDFDKAYEVLLDMKQGKHTVQIPQYSFTQDRRLQTTTKLSPANIIFFQGLMAFYDPRIRDLMTYKIFIHCDDDIRLCRRLIRDTQERGRTVVSVLKQYNKFVKDSFKRFVYPTIIYADLIIPGFRNNRVSVDFIVQHIKNISRHISFKEKARRTKIYCFGQNEFYDLEYHDSTYQSQMTVQQSSFLVFPTAQQHKRQLQFFISTLLTQSFTYQYYQQVYLHQFVKILKSLLQHLITLKNYNLDQIQLLSIYQINDVFKVSPGKRYIKAIFIPSAIYPYTKDLLLTLKQYCLKYPKTQLILLNIFGDLSFPSAIYQFDMPATVLINLYAITSQRRFRQILIGNSQAIDQSFKWLIENRLLTKLSLKNISESLQISLALNADSKESFYQFAIENQQFNSNDKQEIPKPLNKQITIDFITQIPTYHQQHGNICGFHTLSSIMTPHERLTDKKLFIQNYYKLKQLLIPLYELKQYLKVSDYEPLQRKDLAILIKPINMDTYHQAFAGKTICTLYYGFGYIQNSKQELYELTQCIKKLKQNKIGQLYVVMGIMDHYFLVILKDKRLIFIDSLNTNLQEIMKTDMNDKKISSRSKKRKRYIRQALKIIEDIYLHNKSVFAIAAQLKIEEIIGSFNQINNGDIKSQQEWFKDQYRPEVIKSDLFDSLKGVSKDISQMHKKMLNDWLNNQYVKSVIKQIPNFSQ